MRTEEVCIVTTFSDADVQIFLQDFRFFEHYDVSIRMDKGKGLRQCGHFEDRGVMFREFFCGRFL